MSAPWLKGRLAHWRAIAWGPVLAVLGGLYALLGLLSFVKGEFLQGFADRPLVKLLPSWSVETWVIVGLAIAAAATLEGSFRHDSKRQETIDRLRVLNATDADLVELANHRRRGVNLWARGPQLREEEMASWIGQHDVWRTAAIEFMRGRFPEDSWSRFETIGPLPAIVYEGVDDSAIQRVMRLFDMEIHRLEDVRNEALARRNAANS